MKKKILLLLGLLLFAPVCAQGAQQRNEIRMGGDLTVESGTTVYDAIALGGNVIVNGKVEHDAVALGGSVTVNRGGSVGNNIVSLGGKVFGSTATVSGRAMEVDPRKFAPSGRNAGSFFRAVGFLSTTSFLLLALLVTALVPHLVSSVSLVVEKDPAPSALWGLIGAMLIVPVAILLAVTFVGIMLIPVELALVFAGFLFGYIAVSAFVGRKIETALRKSGWSLLGETLLGAAALMLAGWIPILGWLITLMVFVVGFGAVLLSLFRRSPEQSPAIISG